ncbi:hypothetical protein SEVIR_3G308600v4 [Setaria viridis]|uniref:Kazal-like domain-containing protein n=1 Tax=Setaria viridis TaxID=4556 RepID=A0A4U6VJI1_SETVI|nr:hypothetical protein SEVIR_3G308600v2 [Setaria viridis]
MASTAATVKGALVLAVCLVQLHSSMAQQQEPAPAPPSPPDCGNYCFPICTQRCQAQSVAEHGKCNTTLEFYDDCFNGCTSQCKGNSYAHGSCTMGSCSAKNCGNPCARSCCESCSNTAPDLYYRCMSSHGMDMISCMGPCMNDCTNNCFNGSVPPSP